MAELTLEQALRQLAIRDAEVRALREKLYALKPFAHCYKCQGDMAYTGEELTSFPPHPIFVCMKCGMKAELDFHGD